MSEVKKGGRGSDCDRSTPAAAAGGHASAGDIEAAERREKAEQERRGMPPTIGGPQATHAPNRMKAKREGK